MSGGTHLELEERERLAALKAEGLSLRAVARALGRAASTISRERRRNALPKGGYLPAHAAGCYRERRQRPAVLERDERLGRVVRERLLGGWTPEQIARCRAGGRGAAGGGRGKRAAPSPGGARSTTDPRTSRSGRTPGTGRATCCSASGPGRCWCSRSARPA